MYRGLSVAVVIPAFNEERAIVRAIASVPDFVDHIFVVDDASRDATFALASNHTKLPTGETDTTSNVEVLRHPANKGVGAAIVSGYRRALAKNLDVAVVMAGDGQMDPRDLPALLDPIADGRADYTKGNRFKSADVWRSMPTTRIIGNLVLSTATKLSSGYWHVFDSQCGYTAIAKHALESIDLDRVFPRYGYPNDVLARLHVAKLRVLDVPVRAVYGPAWKSGIKLHNVIYPVAFALLRSWVGRVAAESSFTSRGHQLPGVDRDLASPPADR